MLRRRVPSGRMPIFVISAGSGIQMPEHVPQRLTTAAAAHVSATTRALLSRAVVPAALILTSATATAATTFSALVPST